MTAEELLAAYAAGRRNFASARLAGAYLVGTNLMGARLMCANLASSMRDPTDPSIPGWVVVDGRLERTI